MEKRKTLWIMLCLIFVVMLPGCADDTKEESMEETKIVSEEEIIETELAEKESSEVKKDEDTVEKSEQEAETTEEKKINYTHFEDLSLAVEQVGFSFRAIEGTEDAYFSSFSITERQDEDEEGNKVGDPYPTVVLQYREKANKLPAFMVTIYPVQGEIEPPATYVSTEEIEGISVSLTDYILILVTSDYELTDEDWEFVNSGKGSFSSGGGIDGEESHHRSMYWEENGIFYKLASWIPDMPEEELQEIVRAILMAEFR